MIEFIVGCFVGSLFGFITAVLMIAAAHKDDYMYDDDERR